MSKPKFRPGDFVIGNKLANEYSYSKEGTIWRVQQVIEHENDINEILLRECNEYGQYITEDGEPISELIDYPRDRYCPKCTVKENCFDLYNDKIKFLPELSDPEEDDRELL